MKKPINLFKICMVVLIFSLPGHSHATGNQEGSEKKKTISKSFTVSSADKLKIENSFGDVTIHTWDKNEFKVDIEISTKAPTDEKAQYILDHITVTDSRSDNTVSFKTNIHIDGENNNEGDDNDNGEDNKDRKKETHNHSHGNHEFHINYVVYMPSSNPLQIENSFGKTIVPDFKGMTNISDKFGGLTAGNLDNVESIDVQFGKCDIGHVQNGKLNLQYDDHSKIGSLGGNLKIVVAFCGHTQIGLDNAIQDLSIKESYSSVRLIASKELSASFTIHTNFGEFHNGTEFKFTEAEEEDDNAGPHFDKDFTGMTGDGKAKIKIKSSFGDIKLSHTADSDEQKERPEKKERKEKKEKKEADEQDEQ